MATGTDSSTTSQSTRSERGIKLPKQARPVSKSSTSNFLGKTQRRSIQDVEQILEALLPDRPVPDLNVQPTYGNAIHFLRRRIEQVKQLQLEILNTIANVLPRDATTLHRVQASVPELLRREYQWQEGLLPLPTDFWQRLADMELHEAMIVDQRSQSRLWALCLLNRLEAWLFSTEEDLFMAARVRDVNARIPWGWGFPPQPLGVEEELWPRFGRPLDFELLVGERDLSSER